MLTTFLLLMGCAGDSQQEFDFQVPKGHPESLENVTETGASEEESGLLDSDDSTLCGDRDRGVAIGDCALDFSLLDDSGQLVSLHEFFGQVIFLDLSSFT